MLPKEFWDKFGSWGLPHLAVAIVLTLGAYVFFLLWKKTRSGSEELADEAAQREAEIQERREINEIIQSQLDARDRFWEKRVEEINADHLRHIENVTKYWKEQVETFRQEQQRQIDGMREELGELRLQNKTLLGVNRHQSAFIAGLTMFSNDLRARVLIFDPQAQIPDAKTVMSNITASLELAEGEA